MPVYRPTIFLARLALSAVSLGLVSLVPAVRGTGAPKWPASCGISRGAGGIAQGEHQASPVAWVVLRANELHSEGGAALSILDDGSVMASGANPLKDSYTVTCRTELRGLTGVRLEAIPDSLLPHRGPGRAGGGNFILSELRLDAASRFSSNFRPVPIRRVLADFSQRGWPVTGTIDGNLATGWAIHPHQGRRSTAFFELAKPIDYKTGTKLQFKLVFNYGHNHALGRLRISVTNDPEPLRDAAGLGGAQWAKIQAKIDKAIDQGVAYLIESQHLDGSWSFLIAGYPSGQTALAVYTLLKSGVGPDQPVIRRALEFMKLHPPRKTYTMACHILALCALDDPEYQDLLEEDATTLILWQKDGGFGYPGGAVDLSNTQYAALAFHKAALGGSALEGVDVPRDVWVDLIERTLKHQQEGGGTFGARGFAYRPRGNPSGSMTAAGVAVLEICSKHLRRARSDVEFAKKCGLEWLARHFSATNNPVEDGQPAGRWLFYYLYGLERVGGLVGTDKIGAHDWYREGATFLVDVQGKEGQWGTAYGESEPNTCFALLFLSRATAAVTGQVANGGGSAAYGKDDPDVLVNLRASGDCPLNLWISSFGETATEPLEWPGEKGRGLRIDRVEYFVLPDGTDEPAEGQEPIASAFGDESKPAGFERFPVRITFPRPGSYRLAAAVVAMLPPDEDGSRGDFEVLYSGPLEVHIRQGFTEALMRYASDGERNLLAKTKVTATASSEYSGGWRAAFATDNLMARAWLSKDGDPKPTLSLVLERPVRADTILLTPAYQSKDKDRTTRIKRVRVLVNGRKPGYELEMIPDDLSKTELLLPKPLFVRRIEIQVIESTPGHPQKNAVGLSEVELQYRKYKGHRTKKR